VRSSSSIRGESDWRGKQYTVVMDDALPSIACGAEPASFCCSSVVIEPISHHISVVIAEILGQYLIAMCFGRRSAIASAPSQASRRVYLDKTRS
jgi:hypothetical protein